MFEGTDLVVMLVVLGLRLFVPLAIPKYPLPAGILSLVIDGLDKGIFQAFTDMNLDWYQGYDKALDVYYLAIAYLSTMRNWGNLAAFGMSRFLWYYRLVGVLLFEFSQIRAMLLLFPNTFEYFFLFYEGVRTRWNPKRLGVAAVIAAAFAITRNLGYTVLAYLALTTAYTYKLKRMPVYDIVAVAAGFVLRAVAGAAATNVSISQWFFIVTSFGALLMVVGKREGERALLADDAGSVRATLGAYTENYLLYLRAVASGVVLVGYCLWAFESASKPGVAPDATIWFELSVVPFVIAILRYALLLDQGEGAEPERLVLKDRPLLVAGACWAMIYAYGIYIA